MIAPAVVMLLPSGDKCLVDAADVPKLAVVCWGASPGKHTTYVRGYVDGKKVALHRFLLDPPDDMEVDHINGNGLDNRRCNMRIATPQQNRWNRTSQRKPKSGYRGVYIAGAARWGACISANGKTRELGLFDSPEEAHEAYRAAALEVYGEFAAAHLRGDVVEIDTSEWIVIQQSPGDFLSDREYDVLMGIANGKPINDIATELSLSPSTVSTFRLRALKKLGLKSNADAVRFADNARATCLPTLA